MLIFGPHIYQTNRVLYLLDLDCTQTQEKWHFLIGRILGPGKWAGGASCVHRHLLDAVNRQAAASQSVDIILQRAMKIQRFMPLGRF
jgi:hypothetical protein